MTTNPLDLNKVMYEDSDSDGERTPMGKKTSSRYRSFVTYKSEERPRTMLAPTVDPHIDLPQIRGPGLLHGLFSLIKCQSEVTNENDIDTDIRENSLSVTPPSFLSFLALLLVYCLFTVFIIPDGVLPTATLPVWHGGEMSLVEVVLPLLSYIVFILSLANARALGVKFDHYEIQHVMHPRLLRSLEAPTLTLSRDGVQRLEKVNNYGHCVSKRAMEALRRTGFAGRPDLVTCDVYAKYLCSMASIFCCREYQKGTYIYSIVAPFFICISPVLPRLSYGGSLWAEGKVENVMLSLLGPLTSFLSIRMVLGMLAIHSETLLFQREKIKYLTLALPDPGANMKDWEHWPQVNFESLSNIMTWHRLRWALSYPPLALDKWGSRLFEWVCLLCFTQIGVAVGWVVGNGRNVPLLDPVISTTAILCVFAFPLVLHMLSFSLRTNQYLDSHVLSICRIMLFSMRSDTVDTGDAATATSNFDREKSGKLREVRHVLRDLATALPLQTRHLRFYGLKVRPPTIALVSILLFVIMGLFLLRFFFGLVLV